jgi:alpha(1,3/1,4) fucosyltransferase
MTKPRVRISFINGLSFLDSPKEIFGDLLYEFELIEDKQSPAVVVFGPYGNDVPKGDFIRVGYFCENFIPDMNACEYGFGVPYETEINHPEYRRIDFHGFDPNRLIKNEEFALNAQRNHSHFCNFLYGNKVPYREEFFKELTKYKRVDAPGLSMNNMPKLSTDKDQNMWESKRQFISKYKFTIAFENYTYPGYMTEKMLDPMLAGSMPIYIGNPEIHQHFNTESFVNAREWIEEGRDSVTLLLEKIAQPNYNDWRPSIFNSIPDKVQRKLKIWGRQHKLKREFRHGYKRLIEEIIRLDQDDDAYYTKLAKPWLINNQAPDRSRFLTQWRKILHAGKEC